MYTEKKDAIFDSTTAVVLTSAAVIKKFTVLRSLYLRKIAFGVSVATVSTASIVITVKKYVTLGSAVGEVTLGTLTIPAGLAAGAIYYKQLATPAKITPGQEIVFEVTTAAAGGGAAGSGFCMFDSDDNPETSLNQSVLVASA